MQMIPRVGLAFCAGIALAATSAAQSALEQKRDGKLAAKWLKAAAWGTDFDQSRARAAKNGELIFAYFTRSFAP